MDNLSKIHVDQRSLPLNIEAEQALLGAVLLNNDAFHLVANIIMPEHFSNKDHAEIWKLIKDQIENGLSANPITLKSYVEDKLIGDIPVFQYIVRLATEAVTVANVKDFARVIIELATRRKLINMSEKLKNQAYDIAPSKPVETLLSDIEKELYQLQDEAPVENAIGTASSTADKLIKLYEKKEQPKTIPLPIREIQEVLGGELEAGNLYGILSGSGEGKTSLTMQIVDYAASNGHPVLFLSYDQSEEQSIMQIACQRLGLDSKRIRSRTLTVSEIESYFKELIKIRTLPIQIKMCVDETIFQLRSYAQRFIKWNKSKKTPLIVVDHISRISADANSYEGKIMSIINSRSKAFARENGITWLNLMQRKTLSSTRVNPNPSESDIFGGSQGKQDYDVILYLYRPEKYKDFMLSRQMSESKEDKIIQYLEKWSGKSKLGLLKNRFSDESITKALEFEPEYTRYKSTYEERSHELFQSLS